MYNLPLVTSRCSAQVLFNLCFSLLRLLYQFIFRFMLCVLYFTCILFVLFAVTVCKCHIAIKGYLLTYLFTISRERIDQFW